ncbi:hypothetical protein CTAYLR_000884 [Chrysophaeum taylorii]|uniref:DM10 domain-containing protein n=1 Tax=Chrysophaeum taylorii TaxID=2483200 RepID=A0AAD7UF30_9STRA|nr:hypothetical protein CTAYLR_000884 [Chrysophaeum taylorii]
MERPYAFLAEWYDPQPMMVREFLLKYYEEEQQVELFDLKTRRQFLKKSPLAVKASELYVGNEIVVHARVLKLVQFGDDFTRMSLESAVETSVALVTPDATRDNARLGAVLSLLEADFSLRKLKLVQLTESEAMEACSILQRDDGRRLFAGGRCVAVAVSGASAVDRLVAACGRIRDALGANGTEDLVTPAPDAHAASLFGAFAFGPSRNLRGTARFGADCACCVVRPHAVADKHCGHIIAMIPFEISAMELFKLDAKAASEFLEVYDGVVPDFQASVQHLALGPCLALELQGAGVVKQFRHLCGPWDLEFAKELRPDSIRAKFGHTTVKNAVHCTDLPDDGELESKYFFQVLQSS